MPSVGRGGHDALRVVELRTRRLVVTDAEDRDRIVGEVVDNHTELWIAAGPEIGHPEASVLVYAGADPDLGPAIGIQLWSEGQSVAEINAWHLGGNHWQWAINGTDND